MIIKKKACSDLQAFIYHYNTISSPPFIKESATTKYYFLSSSYHKYKKVGGVGKILLESMYLNIKKTMANNQLLVDEKQIEVGNFIVGRLLPVRKKRQVGPFTFIDHMGPGKVRAEKGTNVDQHPHIGLSTLTYLFEGEVEHKDSTGAVQVVKPGDVAFMTSGSGCTHTERTPEHLKGKDYNIHGYQIWVALPKEKEEMTPNFQYFEKNQMPEWNAGNLKIRLIAGNAFGASAPLQGYSPLYMVDVKAVENEILDLRDKLTGEVAFVIVKGSITDQGETIKQGQMLISKSNEECEITLTKGTHLLIFGGAPLPEERFLMWNFVSSSKERLEQAKKDWTDNKFPKVPGDETYIPFPVFNPKK